MNNPLLRYHGRILQMQAEGKNITQMANAIYDLAIGPVDPHYRDVDIRFIHGLIWRYLENCETAETLLQARQQRDMERKHRAKERERNAVETQAEIAQEQEQKRKKERDRRRRAAAAAALKEAERIRAERRQAFLDACAKVTPWRDRDWTEILPPPIAAKQATWCRQRAALRMRRAGLKFKEIGYRLGISGGRAQQIVEMAERYEKHKDKRSPIERWMEDDGLWFETRWQQYDDPSGRKRCRRALKVVEAWTGLPTVPRCKEAERQVWEAYYTLREGP